MLSYHLFLRFRSSVVQSADRIALVKSGVGRLRRSRPAWFGQWLSRWFSAAVVVIRFRRVAAHLARHQAGAWSGKGWY
jgi:hypothetical protein